MIRVRRVFGRVAPADRAAVAQVQEILKQDFGSAADYAGKIPERLDNPFPSGYQTVLLVAEKSANRVAGFSLFLYLPEIHSVLLDFLVVARDIRSGGVGTVLYEATREYCRLLGANGLYMEVAPDDPALETDAAVLKENIRRLRYYEQFGARPIVGTAYETPIGPSTFPYLVFDPLGRSEPLRRSQCRAAMRLILERKYSHLVDAEYIDTVVASVTDDPVRIRPPKYVRPEAQTPQVGIGHVEKPFAMVVSTNHVLHHVQDRGYVERPARVDAIRQSLEPLGVFAPVPPRHHGDKAIRAVHDGDFVTYLDAMCRKLTSEHPVYPYVFPIRRPDRRPKDLAVRAGYYCIDTFTPLNNNAYQAARGAVDVALTAAEEILAGRAVAYALCRPPGHHAEKRVFGGFCYFNNAAIAAQHLSAFGTVAMLDIDFHHGNGAQDIFYHRRDVLTVSLHGHPNFAYPYFSGFADERGTGDGQGFNRNFPLPEGTNESAYLQALAAAVRLIRKFDPAFLVLCLGLDTMKGDPTGGFTLTAGSLGRIGHAVGALDLPTLVVQEGGYSLPNLRRGARAFFTHLAQVRAGQARRTRKSRETRQ